MEAKFIVLRGGWKDGWWYHWPPHGTESIGDGFKASFGSVSYAPTQETETREDGAVAQVYRLIEAVSA